MSTIIRTGRFLSVFTLLAWCSAGGRAQEDPYRALRTYDFQNRVAVDAVQRQIQQAGKDPAKLAAIELKLIEVLRDPSATFAARQEVCKFLSFMGSARSVPVLAALLQRDAREAEAARYALEGIPGPEASTALRRALQSSRGNVRVGIISSLGVKKDPLAVPLLARLTGEGDPVTRTAAVQALGHIGTPQALNVLAGVRPRDLAVSQALLRAATAVVRSGNRGAGLPVITSLTKVGTPAPVRVAALRALADLRHPSTINVALSLMNEPDPYLRRGAAAVVGRLGASDTKAVLARWGSVPQEARVVLLQSWADRREPLAAEIALRSVRSEQGEVRLAAIRAAARCAGSRAIAVLAETAVQDPDLSEPVRQSLAAMSGAGVQETMVQLASQGKPEVRAFVLDVLGDRPGTSSAQALMTSARSQDEAIATAALRALSRGTVKPDLAVMLDVLKSAPSDSVRVLAAGLVVVSVQMAPDRTVAVKSVLDAHSSAAKPAQIALLRVLASLGGPEALERLQQATASADPEIKRAAVQSLANVWSDGSARPVLLELARSDSERSIRILALRGFIRLTQQDGSLSADERVGAFGEALKVAERAEEKQQVLGALRECRTESAVTLAASLLEDEDLFADAAETILDLAAPQKRNNLELPAVRGAATEAALDRIIQTGSDETLKERARKLR